MALTLAQYQTLKTEFQGDPNGYGYAAHIASGNDDALAGLLNLLRPELPPLFQDVPVEAFAGAIRRAGYAALTADDKGFLDVLLRGTVIRAASTAVRTDIGGMFPDSGATQATRQALLALAQRDSSRAEQLIGTTVSHTDVAIALRAT